MDKRIKVGFSIKGLYQYYHMIKPIIDAKPSLNYEFYIFHLNRYYSFEDSNIDIEGVHLVDLKGGENVVDKIKMLELDYMLMFSPGQIFDVFINLVCAENNIKTIYYQHGLSLPFGSFNIKSVSQGRSYKDNVYSLRKYIYFYRVIIGNVFRIRNKKRYIKAITKRTFQILFLHGNSNYPKYGLKEFHCDYGLVFGENDRQYLLYNNGFIDEDIWVGGYPMLKSNILEEKLPSDFVLYLSSGLRTSNVIPITENDERQFYISLAKSVKQSSKFLVIKLHPTENLELFKNYVRDFENVSVYKDINLSSLVERSSVVIGDYSTALFFPIKFKKPLILLQSKYFDKYPFDYSDYGVGEKVNIEELNKFIINPPALNDKNYSAFMKNFISDNEEINSIELLYQELLLTK